MYQTHLAMNDSIQSCIQPHCFTLALHIVPIFARCSYFLARALTHLHLPIAISSPLATIMVRRYEQEREDFP